MPQLETISAHADSDEILEVFRRDGACILSDALDLDLAQKLMVQVSPFVDNTKTGHTAC